MQIKMNSGEDKFIFSYICKHKITFIITNLDQLMWNDWKQNIKTRIFHIQFFFLLMSGKIKLKIFSRFPMLLECINKPDDRGP